MKSTIQLKQMFASSESENNLHDNKLKISYIIGGAGFFICVSVGLLFFAIPKLLAKKADNLSKTSGAMKKKVAIARDYIEKQEKIASTLLANNIQDKDLEVTQTEADLQKQVFDKDQETHQLEKESGEAQKIYEREFPDILAKVEYLEAKRQPLLDKIINNYKQKESDRQIELKSICADRDIEFQQHVNFMRDEMLDLKRKLAKDKKTDKK